MTCSNIWSRFGYSRVWEDADYFYGIDRPGGVTQKKLKSEACRTQPVLPVLPVPQGNTWMKWALVGIAFIMIMFISGGRR